MIDYKTDYSPHYIETDHHLRHMHRAFLKGDLNETVAQAEKALVELRLALVAVKHLRDQKQLRE